VDEAARHERAIDLVQGAYYAATGAWPLLHLPSFLAVTGEKVDRWLVRSYGALTLAVGIALLVPLPGEPRRTTLGRAAAVAIGLPEAWYVARRRIRPVYAIDAAVQAAFVLARR
jgi:hypothetical protein